MKCEFAAGQKLEKHDKTRGNMRMGTRLELRRAPFAKMSTKHGCPKLHKVDFEKRNSPHYFRALWLITFKILAFD